MIPKRVIRWFESKGSDDTVPLPFLHKHLKQQRTIAEAEAHFHLYLLRLVKANNSFAQAIPKQQECMYTQRQQQKLLKVINNFYNVSKDSCYWKRGPFAGNVKFIVAFKILNAGSEIKDVPVVQELSLQWS